MTLSKLFFFSVGKIASIFYNYSISQKVKRIKDSIFSGWISGSFLKYGSNSTICSKVSVIGGKYISVGDNTRIGKNTVLTAWDNFQGDLFNPRIIIGNNVTIGNDNHITAINRIEIGNGVLTGKWLTITDHSHGKTDLDSLAISPIKRKLYSPSKVIIEDNVWIGDKVTVLPNVRIGKNSVIGSNSVITKNIPENCVAAGIPAKIINRNKNEE